MGLARPFWFLITILKYFLLSWRLQIYEQFMMINPWWAKLSQLMSSFKQTPYLNYLDELLQWENGLENINFGLDFANLNQRLENLYELVFILFFSVRSMFLNKIEKKFVNEFEHFFKKLRNIEKTKKEQKQIRIDFLVPMWQLEHLSNGGLKMKSK